ncbi:cation/H(+) antiporter 15-like [Magnolia sinica]|uniref:cation/H(+) antiporter 15-like n=1 Tax=Magnolia sinica TaxID=86752 RepID=UPI00265A8A72|nr:cation/H(+) antiporter 15-like [Magnolia sinica]
MEATTILRAVAGNITSLHGQGMVDSGVMCHLRRHIHSVGVFNGENSMKAALPLLMLQISLMNIITRGARYILRPFKQPSAIADIIGGIIVGPTLLGRSKTFNSIFFPSDSYYTMATLARMGTVFYFLIQGLKMDPMLIRKSGKREVVIAVFGFLVPLTLYFCVYHILVQLQGTIIIEGIFMIILGVVMSLSIFSTIHPIIEELNLLNLELGRITLSASLIHFFTSMVGILIFDTIRNGRTRPLMGLMFFVSLVAVSIFVVFIIRPIALWTIRRTHEGGTMDRSYISGFQFMTMVMAFIGNFFGSAVFNGSLLMGLAIPAGRPLASAIVDKTEAFINVIFLPLFFGSIGLRCNVFSVTNWMNFVNLQLLITVAFIGRLVGTLLPALYYKIPFRDSLALGLMMNLRGVVEVTFCLHWLDSKMIENEVYGTLVLLMVVITAILSPIVQMLTKNVKPYRPYNMRTIEHFKHKTELCILTCINRQDNVPTIINLLEATHSDSENPICVYLLNTFELLGRAMPILIEHEKLKRLSSMNQSDSIVSAFRNYEQRNKGSVAVRPFAAMAPYSSMHHDICKLALDKKVSLLIVPYHKQQAIGGISVVNRAFRTINPNILAESPCSVGIIVDRAGQAGNAKYSSGNLEYRVGVLILGGCDCREVLSYALRMSENPQVKLTVMRLIPTIDSKDCLPERQQDNQLVAHFRVVCSGNNRVVYREKSVSNGEQTVKALRSMGDNFDLIMVGRRLGLGTSLIEGLTDWTNSPDLGVIGDIVASPDFFQAPVSVLVVQQGKHGCSGVHLPGLNLKNTF